MKIVEAGSFSRAAALLYVAQPALSSQIADLEQELGVELLHRNARGIKPTTAGDVLYEEACELIRTFDHIPEVLHSTSLEVSGSVKLGMASALSYLFAGPFMKACKEALPGVSLSHFGQDSTRLRTMLVEHTLDLAVILETDLMPGLTRTELFEQRLYALHTDESHRTTASLELAEVGRWPLIAPSQSTSWRPLLEKKLAAAGVTPNIVAETHDIASYIAAVRSGVGATIMPMGDLTSLSGTGGIIATPISDLRLTASLASAHDRSLPRAAEAVHALLVPFIQRHIREQHPTGMELLGS